MDPLTLGAIVGAGANVVGSLFGWLSSNGKYDEAKQLLEAARQQYGNIQLPGFEQPIDQLLTGTAMSGVKPNAQAVQAQSDALNKLTQLGNGGLTSGDKTAIQQSLQTIDQNEGATRGAILNNMHSRGLSDSGMELAAQLAGTQQQAQSANQVGSNAVVNAQQRALQALMQQGQLGSSIRGQDFGEQAQKAQAQDAINQYNAQARERGTAARNATVQQTFGDQMAQVGGQATEANNEANMAMGKGSADSSALAGLGQGLGYSAAAYGMGASRQTPPPLTNANNKNNIYYQMGGQDEYDNSNPFAGTENGF